MPRVTVLVVEDDAAIRRGLADALAFAGYGVLECGDGAKAAATAIESDVKLVLLDVMLPGRDGFAILADLRRARPTLPVIMVTARGSERDRVRGLCDGADDYVVKPFSAKELLARVEAVLRRSPARSAPVHQLQAGNVTIDLDRRELRVAGASDGSIEQITERERDILLCLAANRDRAVDRDELLQCAWGLDPRGLETRTVDMQIARLREKLGGGEAGSDAEAVIETVRGKGYKLGRGVRVVADAAPRQPVERAP